MPKDKNEKQKKLSNAEKMFLAFNELDDSAFKKEDGELIDIRSKLSPSAAASENRAGRASSRKKIIKIFAAAAAAAALLIGTLVFLPRSSGGGSSEVLAAVRYPEMPFCPNERDYVNKATGRFRESDYRDAYTLWREERDAKKDLLSPQAKVAYLAFVRQSVPELGKNAGKDNMIYSPASLYSALSVLAETSGGQSRAEILALLGKKDAEGLAADASAFWKSRYSADGVFEQKLANSIWLRDDLPYQEETIERLAEQFYTSSFKGEMGSADYNKRLQAWIREQAGELLDEQAGEAALDPQTLLSIFSTVSFEAKWHEPFIAMYNEKGIFHGSLKDQEAEFMKASDNNTYYWADDFGAIRKDFLTAGEMWFILPDEGKPIDQILQSEALYELISPDVQETWENAKTLKVNFALPKFKLGSDLDLIDVLRSLGLNAVFDPEKADFSPLLGPDAPEASLSEAKQSAVLEVDEEGVKAAGLTRLDVVGAAAPLKDEIDFVLDRPFIVVINGLSGLPLFVAVISQL